MLLPTHITLRKVKTVVTNRRSSIFLAMVIFFTAPLLFAPAFTQALAETDMSKSEQDIESRNKAIVQASFEAWKSGTGSPFDLLTEDATWALAASHSRSGVSPVMAGAASTDADLGGSSHGLFTGVPIFPDPRKRAISSADENGPFFMSEKSRYRDRR